MQYPKTTLVVLGSAALLLLGHFYSEVFNAVLADKFLDWLAQDIFGTERPKMMTYIDPYVVPFCVVAFVAVVAFNFGRAERSQTSPLQILYDPNDRRHVEAVSGSDASRYYIEVFNRGYDRSITDLTVEWDSTPFTDFVDGEARRQVLLSNGSISPREKQRINLFGLDNTTMTTPNPADVLGHDSHVVVRARGTDAAEVTATFEYSPMRFPKLLRVS